MTLSISLHAPSKQLRHPNLSRWIKICSTNLCNLKLVATRARVKVSFCFFVVFEVFDFDFVVKYCHINTWCLVSRPFVTLGRSIGTSGGCNIPCPSTLNENPPKIQSETKGIISRLWGINIRICMSLFPRAAR